jgi:acyl-CoA reductase-like NAD-dependent aldehyde dehydrogenase
VLHAERSRRRRGKAAAAAFPAWSNTPIPQRIQLMFRFKALLDSTSTN